MEAATSSHDDDAQELTYEESTTMIQQYYCSEFAASKDSTDIEGASSFGVDEEEESTGTVEDDELIRHPSAVFQVHNESGHLMCYNRENSERIVMGRQASTKRIAEDAPGVAEATAPPQKQQESSRNKTKAKKAKKSTKRSCAQTTVDAVKYFYSMTLLVVSVAVVMAAIFTRQTKIARDVSPWLAFGILWGLIIWLAVMEGGQNCLVGLQPIDKQLYADSHLVASMCTNLAHKGDNMRRFIIGRQFLVVLVVFMINLCGSPIGPAPSVLGFPPLLTEIFLSSGLALIMMTTTLGQLTAQINAAIAMLDFINNYAMLLTTYISLAIECSGLLHAVYLVQVVFAKIAGTPIESKEPPRSVVFALLFWGRVLMSVTILGFAFAVTLTALFQGSTTMYSGVPEWASGLLEGMQIALFAVVNLPEDDLKNYTLAAKTCALVFRDSNLQAFLIGRQICATICTFIIARITSINVEIGSDGATNIFGVGNGWQNFFNTGLLGALITTVVGSLAWRIIAASFPVAFLSNPLIFLIVQLCLLLEASGACSAAWLLAWIHKKVVGYHLDMVYIGTPKQRAMIDDETEEATLPSP
jgi:hypothetical protein